MTIQYNAQQQAAITAPLGPMMIVAGPGTGKTATIVGRIQYLIERAGIAPERILAISFTRKAAAELRKRVAMPAVTTTTIHALALQLIREQQPEYLVTDETLEHLIIDCLTVLRAQPAYLKNVQARWQSVLVDEFQDVDAEQAELIDLLTAAHNNLCVIGDPDQSIYGFRGATRDVLLHFSERYPAAQTYFLQDNYRSQANIIDAATALIQHNQLRFSQITQATKPAGSQIQHTLAPTAIHEAQAVLDRIQQAVGASDHLAIDRVGDVAAAHATRATNYSFSDIAIIYRLNAVGDQIERVIAESGLPYHRIGQVGVFELLAVREFIQQLPNIALATTHTLAQQLPPEFQTPHYDDFRALIESYDDLSAAAARRALLDHALIARPEDDWQAGHNALTLLTAHAAKGLEFPMVCMVGAEEGIFPYTEAAECDREEERRLFYVAMTRAQNDLHIFSALQRLLFGKIHTRESSAFMHELPPTLLTTTELPARPRRSQQPALL